MHQANQANVEYWFRLFYECIRGACFGNVNYLWFTNLLTELWFWITIIGYLLSFIALLLITYCLSRLYELRRREEEYYSTLVVAPEEASVNHRWDHISSLIDSTNPSDWRTAIIEADIMLDDLLTKQGYGGESVGEKLRSVGRSDLGTLTDAWEAHKVRNQIAHEGAAFALSDSLARRTIAHYEAVFRELGAV